MKDKIIEDWELLLSNKISRKNFINKYWENFIWLYVKIFCVRDDADLIFKLNDIISKIQKMDIIPIFKNENQFSKYIKISLIHLKKVQNVKRKIEENLIINYDTFDINEYFSNKKSDSILKMDLLIHDIENILTENQLEVIMLLLKGFSRKHISELLGISLQAVNNRIYFAQEKLKSYLNL